MSDTPRTCCVCGCEYFVWWIEAHKKYSLRTQWFQFDPKRHPQAVCADCNRELAAQQAKEGGKSCQK